jgi:spore maturation protein SpmB
MPVLLKREYMKTLLGKLCKTFVTQMAKLPFSIDTYVKPTLRRPCSTEKKCEKNLHCYFQGGECRLIILEKNPVDNTNIFDSFVHGAKDGFTTGVRVLPYMIAMLVALSIFRNSGLMNIVMSGVTSLLAAFGVDPQIIQAIPVALMRPFSAGGSRGFMLDAMKTYGADSIAGQLSCLFQGAAETTFYVVALYFGSVNIKDSRYALSVMLLVDLVCIITAIFVVKIYF